MNKTKKILFISHEFGVNGSSASLLSLIKGINKDKDNIEMVVLLPWMPSKYKLAKKEFETNGIKCREFPYRINYKYTNQRKTIKECLYDILNYVGVWLIGIYIKKNKFDIICSNSSAVDVGARAARLTNTPHVYYIREFMEEDHGLEYRNKRRMRKLLESSEYIIFISKAIEKKYVSLYKLKNTKQFYNDFDISKYYIANHPILTAERINLIQVGMYSDGKGTLNSIELMHKLRDEGIEDFHLEFIGEGSQDYKTCMRQLIDEHQLHSHITISPYAKNIEEKMSNADILLMNSRAEGMGRVTIEGMLAGCLVLGRNEGGTAELLKHDVSGLLYNNEQEFVSIVRDIINDRSKGRKIAEFGQKWALKEFALGKAAENFCDFVGL